MKQNKYILGIETSCDDTSVAIIEDCTPPKILSHLRFGQEEILKIWGGVVPEIAARNHLAKITPLLKQCLEESKIDQEDIKLISVTTHPGLLGPLLTGVNAAKALSLFTHIPILPANHLYAHLEAIHIDQQCSYPYLGLLISGGHSAFFWVESHEKFTVLGGTIDDACGEAFDKGGKILGLGYPAGHIIDKLARFGDKEKYEFPIGLKSSADTRLSFSGLKTALKVFCEQNSEVLPSRPTQFESKEDSSQIFYDVCASYQNAIVKALLLKMRYAIKKVKEEYHFQSSIQIVIGGGVACNSAIRETFQRKYPGTKLVHPKFCTDNGAMIANFGRLNSHQAIPYPACLELDAKGRFLNKAQV